MTSIDPRRPVIVAVGQHTQRTNEGAEVLPPAVLLAAALRNAILDAEAPGAAAAVDSVRLVRSLAANDLRNAPALVARLAGLRPRETVLVNGGGETPGAALARACEDLTAGRVEMVALVAGEAWFSRTRAERAGTVLADEAEDDDVGQPVEHGSMIEFVHPAERDLGIVRPIQEYPLFEQAYRATTGRSVAEHQAHLGRLMAGFSAVAQANPYAWDRAPHDADEIATPTRANRYVGSPYTKLMVSNEQVDMAAAMLVTTVGHARSLGLAEDRWVYPLAAASGAAPLISERLELGDSLLAREVGAALAGLTDRHVHEAAHVDLYSCFPSAVQIQAHELGILDGRALTATGGMRFSGGPWCGYAMHGFAAVVDRLRRDPGSLGAVSANGGAITKLVVTLLSTTPSSSFAYASAQPAIDAHPRRAVHTGAVARATVEACTVMHERDGMPSSGIVACRTPEGARTWGIVRAPEELAAMVAEDVLGRPVQVDATGTARLD